MELRANVPDILTVPEAAEFLKIGRATLYRMIHSGQLKCIKLGRKIRIPQAYLVDFIEHNAK